MSVTAVTFDDDSFWTSLRRLARRLGFRAVVEVLTAYEVMVDRRTSPQAKATIAAALVYLGFPIDAIPDLVPVAGLTDDIAIVGAALVAVASETRPDHTKKARKTARRFVGRRRHR